MPASPSPLLADRPRDEARDRGARGLARRRDEPGRRAAPARRVRRRAEPGRSRPADGVLLGQWRPAERRAALAWARSAAAAVVRGAARAADPRERRVGAAARARLLAIRGDPGCCRSRQLASQHQPVPRRAPAARPAAALAGRRPTRGLVRDAADDGRARPTTINGPSPGRSPRRLDDAYPAGTDVSARPYGERDDYTSLAWLAGQAALNRLGRPADAARMFERYARAARSPQTRPRASTGRRAPPSPPGRRAEQCLARAGGGQPRPVLRPARARAARAPCRRRLTIRQSAPPSARPSPPADRPRRPLLGHDRPARRPDPVRPGARSAETDRERALAAEFGRQIGRPDLGVWAAREARTKGATSMPARLPRSADPAAYARHWALAHGITRQESSFDRTAVSPAGARGMMQLMPGTAARSGRQARPALQFGRLTERSVLQRPARLLSLARLLDNGAAMRLLVASYNAGTGNVRRWIARMAIRACPAPTWSAGSRRSPSPRPAITSSACSKMRSSTIRSTPRRIVAGREPPFLLSREARSGLIPPPSCRGGGPAEGWWRGMPRPAQGPSMLRMVPLPSRCEPGGIMRQAQLHHARRLPPPARGI
jgi:soluble lytic murein transglycosylase-like protein